MSPLDVLRHSVRELRQERGNGRMVVSVDDAQLLDAASAALLHQLASTQTASLLLTARSGETLPDPIMGLRKEGAIGWIELQPLSRTEVEALLGQVLDGHLDAGTRHELEPAEPGQRALPPRAGRDRARFRRPGGAGRRLALGGGAGGGGGPLEAIEQRLRPLSAAPARGGRGAGPRRAASPRRAGAAGGARRDPGPRGGGGDHHHHGEREVPPALAGAARPSPLRRGAAGRPDPAAEARAARAPRRRPGGDPAAPR